MRTHFFLVGIKVLSCVIIVDQHHRKVIAEDKLQLPISLSAEMNASGALDQIRKAFGKYSIESPELYENNHQGFEHIQLLKDEEVGSCFVFFIHRDEDGDQNKIWPKGKERQRNEIKGYEGSPKTMKALENEITKHSWYFKIDPSFSLTHHFCHFYQLKPVGNENSPDPIVTLSGSIHQGNAQLELRWNGTSAQRLKIADWEDCKGRWLRCECITHYSPNGSVKFSVKAIDGSISSNHQVLDFPTWYSSYSFVRPKWGIYRSLRDKDKIKNMEDRVFMNNFSIRKTKKEDKKD